MKPIWQILKASQLGDTLEAVKQSVGGFTIKMAEDLQKILSNGATYKDTLNGAFIEFDARHGTEKPVANPFGAVPVAFHPISAFSLTGSANDLLNFTNLRLTGTQQAIAGQPVLNLSRTDGYLGITVQYDLQHTQPQLAMLGTTNQSVPNNAAAPYTTVIYESTESSRGSTISYSSGTFSVSEAGSYQIMWSAPWEPGATYTDCETWIRFDPNGTFIDLYGYQQARAALTDANWQSCGALIRMAAGAQFQIKAYQTNAATAARTLRGTATAAASARRININRLYNDTTPTARVRGYLVAA